MIDFIIKVGDTEIPETASKLDVFAYEDVSGRSWISAVDGSGQLRVGELFRLAWVVLTRRHGETRSFTEWVEQDDPIVQIGGRPGPTGETPTAPDEMSPVSQPAPDPTPDPSSS